MKIGADDAGNTPRWKFSTAQPFDEQRRSFLGTLLALGSLCVGALLAVPLIRFALFPLLRRTTELKASPVGSLTEFSSLSEPIERTIRLLVVSSICPHLGCTVPWVSEKREFICPCHGAVYAPDGARISGPCLRGMDTLETSERDGRLLVRFQYFRQLVADKEVIG
jgi:menaquinol-cytochrome c reductase iron-sulfur subunit